MNKNSFNCNLSVKSKDFFFSEENLIMVAILKSVSKTFLFDEKLIIFSVYINILKPDSIFQSKN